MSKEFIGARPFLSEEGAVRASPTCNRGMLQESKISDRIIMPGRYENPYILGSLKTEDSRQKHAFSVQLGISKKLLEGQLFHE
jgi:hypothetical protein